MPLVLSLSAVGLFAAAAATDAFTRRIPNGLSLALALIGLLRIGLALRAGGAELAAAFDFGAALAVFALAAVGFHFGVLGGGDVKLLAAGTLWLGAAALGPYLFATALGGGVLAVGFLIWHLMAGGRDRDKGAGLPYAIAIATGGILATIGLPWM